MSKYNGWTNYETWNINLWLGEMNYFSDLDPDISHSDLASEIKSFVEENKPEIPASMYADLLNASISSCNFYEIAKNALSDIQD